MTEGPLMLIINTNGTACTERLPDLPDPDLVSEDNQLRRLQQIVGGWIEAIGTDDGWCAYLNEEGKILGQSPNPAAERLARHLGWIPLRGDFLVGPVVFLGTDGSENSDVPGHVLAIARQMGMLA